MKKKYGIPYQGSKSSILPKLCKLFPHADNFYDLFGGGFSVTHFMIETRSKDFKEFHFNEIRKGVPELIQNAIEGKYNYNVFKPEFIDRDTFFKEKENDAYIKLIWSFGNNGGSYLFSKEIEPYKKSMHNAIVFNKFDELVKEVLQINNFADGYTIKQKRFFLRNKIEWYRLNGVPDFLMKYLSESQIKNLKYKDLKYRLYQLQGLQQLERLEQLQGLQQLQQLEQLKQRKQLQQLERLEQLQRLEQLEQLERLEQLQRLNFYNVDYRKVPIKENSVIYCDIPYINTGDYDKNKHFNHDEFYKWAWDQKEAVFISEYSLPDERYKKIASFKKRSLMNSGSGKLMQENVYANKLGRDLFYKKITNLKNPKNNR